MSTEINTTVYLSVDRVSRNIVRLANQFGIEQLVIETAYYNDDDYYYNMPRITYSHKTQTIKEIVSDIEDLDLGSIVEPREITRIKTTEQFIEFLGWCLSSDCNFQIFTLPQWEKELEQREYLECEKIASQFAGSFGLEFGTQEFLERLDIEINHTRKSKEEENSPEVLAEHWAACQFNGLGHDTFFDDVNFTNSQFQQKLEELKKVWVWLKKKCPLLVLQYEESKLKK